MQIAFHIGAHCTDEDRLLKALLKNKQTLGTHGVAVPGPSRYRKLIRQTIEQLQGVPAPRGTRAILLDNILEEDSVGRIVMSNANFVCVPPQVFDGGLFYRQAEEKLPAFASLFPEDEIEYFLAIRNPATFLPKLAREAGATDLSALMNGVQPGGLRWSEAVARMRLADPRARITVWANEDSPLLWESILRALAGLGDDVEMTGLYDLLSEIMSRPGMRRFHKYLETHPPKSASQRRRVIAAFLEKFSLDEAVLEELDMPGWTQDFVDRLTEDYEDDLGRIAAIDGVRLLTP